MADRIGVTGTGITGLENRHPSIQHFGPLFAYGHLNEGPGKVVSKGMAEVAAFVIGKCPDNPELAAGLRKLLEAKDCGVRATLIK